MRIFPLAIAAALSLTHASTSYAQRPVRAPVQAKAARARLAPKAIVARTRTKPTTRLLVSAEVSPQAAVERTKKLATEYATEHNFRAPRVITMGPAARRVDRVFVPILPETQESFQKKFGASGGNESVILRHTPSNAHMALVAEPGDTYLWGLNYNGKEGQEDYSHLYAQKDGTCSTWPGSSIVVHPTSIGSLTGYLAKNKASGKRCEGHCMVWLPSAPTQSARQAARTASVSEGAPVVGQIQPGRRSLVGYGHHGSAAPHSYHHHLVLLLLSTAID